MIRRGSGPQLRRNAPALRLLALSVGGWAALRVMLAWTPAIPPPPPLIAPPLLAPPSMAPSWASPPSARLAVTLPVFAALDRPARAVEPNGPGAMAMDPASTDAAEYGTEAVGTGAGRHSLRLALLTRHLPGLGHAALRARHQSAPTWVRIPAPARLTPGVGEPFWMQRKMGGWSLDSWLYLRARSDLVPGDGIAANGQLGGSQAGARLSYGLGAAGRARVYGRATMAVQRPEQRELSLGMAYAPVARWPVDIAVERRIAIGKQGRNAMAVMVVGGVGDVALPGGFRLDAYGQAGIVGARRRDGFADGAMVVDRHLGSDPRAPLRIGGFAAGAVQPGVARVDIGPRLTLRLPDVGEGSRIALDWRQRVAGNADPDSGLALTLAAGF